MKLLKRMILIPGREVTDVEQGTPLPYWEIPSVTRDIRGQSDIAPTEPTRVADTIYQNDSNKIRIVVICVALTDSKAQGALVRVDSVTPPVEAIAAVSHDSTDDLQYENITFPVPPDYYYEFDIIVGTPTILNWWEWDMF